MTDMAADVVVVGGGISGYASAAAAAARGAKVILIEKEAQPAWEGSGRAQGSLRLQGRDAAELPLAQEAIERWKALGDEVDCELRFDGNTYLCDDPDELPTLRALVQDAHRAGLADVRLLDRDEAREVLPLATGPFKAAMWSAHDGQCDPAKSTRAFAERAKVRGVTTLIGARGVQTSRGYVEAAVRISGGLVVRSARVPGGVLPERSRAAAAVGHGHSRIRALPAQPPYPAHQPRRPAESRGVRQHRAFARRAAVLLTPADADTGCRGFGVSDRLRMRQYSRARRRRPGAAPAPAALRVADGAGLHEHVPALRGRGRRVGGAASDPGAVW